MTWQHSITFSASELVSSLLNKLLIYKAILKPVWTYGVQLWGSESNSNLEILEGFQSKVLQIITDTPWYVPNVVIKRHLQVLIGSTRSAKCVRQRTNYNCRLKQYYPTDLTYLLHGAESFLRSKPVNFAASQEIPRIYGTQRFLTVPTSASHPSLS